MNREGDLKEYEDQAVSLNPGDNWRKSVKGASRDTPSSTDSKSRTSDKTDGVDTTKNQEAVQKQENNQASPIKFTGGNNKNKGKLSGGKGPLMAVFGGLSASVITIALIGNMFSSILVNMKETLFNDAQSGSARTNKVFRDAAYAKKFTKGSCSKIVILCKFQTMSQRQIDKMKRAGFKLDTPDSGSKTLTGRYRIQSGTFPDGSRFNNAREFHALANSSPERAKSVRYATLGRTSFYLNNKFDKVLSKFKTDKSKKLTGKSKKENDSDVNRKTNGVDSNGKSDQEVKKAASDSTNKKFTEDINNRARVDIGDRIKGGSAKGGYLALPVILGCGAYNMSHYVSAYAKQYHIEQMVKYAMLFLNTADRIKAQGDVSPEVTTYIGDLLTQADPRETITDPTGKSIPNPDYGKTATDAQAYKIAAHGDKTNLTVEAEKFKAGGYTGENNTSWLASLSNYTKSFEIAAAPFDLANKGPLTAIDNISELFGAYISNGGNFNKTINSFANSNSNDITSGQKTIRWSCIKGEEGAMAAYITFCAISTLEVFTGVLTLPGVGQVSGCVAALLCEKSPVKAACDKLTDLALEKALTMAQSLGITKWLASYVQSTAVGSFTKYTDVGNAFGAGEAFLGEKTANGYGLRPATDIQETKDFIASTNKDIYIENQIAIEDAKATPFDITNPYSFLGTAVRSAQLYYDARTPIFSSIASLFRILPAALVSGDTATAYYNQPVQTPDARYDCDDTDLISIGINNADKFCSTVGITPQDELNMARSQSTNENDGFIDNIIKYMTSENGGKKELDSGNEKAGGTIDDSFCDIPGGNNPDCDKVRENSKLPSIDENGRPIENSQYSKYIKYCTENREWPWGTFGEPIQEAKSTRDIDWFSGRQCLKDSQMMQNFRSYYNLCTQLATMDETSECFEDTTTASGGDACSLLNNPNIVLINDGTKKGLEEICQTGHSTNLCNKEFTLNPLLIETMTKLSSKYKVWVNNFGFKTDRNNPSDCTSDTFQHPKGNGVDLNGIEIISGGSRAGGEEWGDINFSQSQLPAVESYANDWMSSMPPTRGGVGQQGCGGFDVTFPATAQLVTGAAFFADSCNHLHIDVRERSDLRAV